MARKENAESEASEMLLPIRSGVYPTRCEMVLWIIGGALGPNLSLSCALQLGPS